MEQILLRKYQQAMQQLQGVFDIAFQRQAELELANVRIAELEAQLKEKHGESNFGVQNGVDSSLNINDQSGRGDENTIA